jgi:hypothetical protein
MEKSLFVCGQRAGGAILNYFTDAAQSGDFARSGYTRNISYIH